MPYSAKVVRVLIASPNDLMEERKVAIETTYGWNVQHSEAEAIVLLPVAWETHATPRSNVRPQQAINQQLADKCDILIGMFWTRLGTFTGVAESGTVEEIDRFVSAGKPAILYYSSRPIDPNAIDAKQHRRLKAFKDSTNQKALTGSFDSLESLRQVVSAALLSEVRSLKLKGTRETAERGTTTSVAIPSDEPDRTDQLNSVPNESWGRDDFQRAIFRAIHARNEERIEALDQAYRKTHQCTLGDNSATWDAFTEWARIVVGKGGQLKRLKILAEANPSSAETLSYLARAYARFDQHTLAANTFDAAMTASRTLERKAKYASLAVEEFSKAKDENHMNAALDTLRKLAVEEPSLELKLTETIKDLLEESEPSPFTIALMERQMELTPDDHELRFKLAHKQSEAGNEDIALHHYGKMPRGDRDSGTWNNMAVAADDLGLPVKSVEFYKKAAAMGNTLAMSNLANKLIKSGFLELAREQCNQAFAEPKPHANVGHSFASLSSVEANEQLRQDEILATVEGRLTHLRKLGRAATLETPAHIAEDWLGPQCTFKLSHQDDQVSLIGQYETPVGGLLSALVSAGDSDGTTRADQRLAKFKYSVKISGQIRGCAVIGDCKRERDGASLLEGPGELTTFMILSDDGEEFTVIENANSNSPTVYSLKRP